MNDQTIDLPVATVPNQTHPLKCQPRPLGGSRTRFGLIEIPFETLVISRMVSFVKQLDELQSVVEVTNEKCTCTVGKWVQNRLPSQGFKAAQVVPRAVPIRPHSHPAALCGLLNDVAPQAVIQSSQLPICPKNWVRATFNFVFHPLAPSIERIKPFGTQHLIAVRTGPSQWPMFFPMLSMLSFFRRLKLQADNVIAACRRVAAINAMQSVSEGETRQVNAVHCIA